MLAQLGITEGQFKAMDLAAQQKIEDKIREIIRQQAENGGDKRAGLVTDKTSRSEGALDLTIGLEAPVPSRMNRTGRALAGCANARPMTGSASPMQLRVTTHRRGANCPELLNFSDAGPTV